MLMKTMPLLPWRDDPAQARVCADCEVRSSALFGALDAVTLEHIHERIAAPELGVGERVYARGESGRALYTVRAGIVRLERVTTGGERRIVRLAGRGDLVGLEALLMQPYADEAVACTPVRLCRIPRALIDELGGSQRGLQRELMQRWQRALEQAESWLADLSSGAARRRMLRLLAELDRLGGQSGEIWLPRRDEIGAMLAMTMETASRLVSQFRREGILELRPPQHARLDRARLATALHAQDAC